MYPIRHPEVSPMKRLYVVGGRERPNAPKMREWHAYEEAVVVELDIETGEAETRLEYVSPPDVCPLDTPSVLFKSGSLVGRDFYLCTQTEAMVYRIPEFDLVTYLSLPCFNDVHHVRPARNSNLYVVSTGLDMVFEVTIDGRIIREWYVADNPLNGQYSAHVDYRLLSTTKPHKSHPNYVFEVDGDLWVTRFEQRDAISLTQQGRSIDIAVERPHDGVVFDGEIYFTTVDGHVVVASAATEQVVRTYDLKCFVPRGFVVGWTRSILPLERDLVVVGFSRLRKTRYRQNLAWIARQVSGGIVRTSLPSRVALVDLRRSRMLWEYNVEALGVNAVFSLHAVPE